ncbi:hypothetical protein RRG08_051127 [Elysia crispata]|uniref:G-protein coupled receptors family 1 profile domain-containing protein n=1 Tax=Elysia crispata TaxID=231223 RepID=A0AAE1DZI4_9GAST|nr:hypothetical protein RRG08_051127 [Elysia crispata]
MEYETIGYVLVLPLLCTFGIAGNIVTLVVLFKERFQGVAYSYLKAIAALDLLSLIFVLPTVTRCSACALRDSSFGPIFEAYLHVFVGDVFVKSSFWTVLIFTAERCVTSCFPTSVLSLLVYRQVWRGREGGVQRNLTNQRHSVAASVTLVLAVAAIENLPTFWNYRIENHDVIRRDIVKRHAFFRFYIWFDAIFSCLIPSLALIILNATLIKFLTRRSRRPPVPAAFTVAGPGPSTEVSPRQVAVNPQASVGPVSRRYRREQTRILVTLVGIILLMLATILPIFVLNLVGQYAPFTSREFLNSRLTISILLAVNCSGNFVLYCMLNPRFWSLFKTIFRIGRCSCSCSCCCCSTHQPATRIIVTRVGPAHCHHRQLQRLQPTALPQGDLEGTTRTVGGSTHLDSAAITCPTSLPITTFIMPVKDNNKLTPEGVTSRTPKSESPKPNNKLTPEGVTSRTPKSESPKPNTKQSSVDQTVNRPFYESANKVTSESRNSVTEDKPSIFDRDSDIMDQRRAENCEVQPSL